MHYLGKELISRNTYVSNRSLIAVAAVTVFSHHYDLLLNELVVFGMSVPEPAINSITLIFLIFLTINYYLSYWGDFMSFREWNVNSDVAAAYDGGMVAKRDTILRTATNAQTALKQMIDSGKIGVLADVVKSIKDDQKIILNNFKDIKNLETIEQDLKEMLKGHSQLNFIANFQLYVWYGLMPLGLSGYAIWITS